MTTDTQLQEVLGPNWDGKTNLAPFIKSGNLMLQQMQTCAARRNFSYSRDMLCMIETVLSAYFYTHMDRTYSQQGEDGATGQFVDHGQSLDGEKERYKRWAIELDGSGCLNALLNRKVAGMVWIGRNRKDQTPLDQR
jgi:hypothetical protein